MKRHINSPPLGRATSGQALLEYALILILVVIALAAALIATGPALGNVFSNTVYNLIGITGEPQDLSVAGGATAFWQTVTAVALNPPEDRGFPPNPPPLPTNSPTPGPSPTPTPITPSPTPSKTPTKPPTPTPTDHSFVAPFIDPIDAPPWWRVDSSVYLGGDDWRGEYYANTTLSGDPIIRYNAELGEAYRYNINFDWGNNPPLPGFVSDNFSVRWTRPIYVFGTVPISVIFTAKSDDGMRVFVDKDTNPTPIINSWYDHGIDEPIPQVTQSLSPGPHVLTVEYYERGGGAGIQLNMSQFKANTPDDTGVPGPANCQWARVTGSQPNTQSWAWEESPLPGNGFPPNMRCHLELRGSVDITALSNPTMEFWDVWDFAAAASVTLQVAEYQPYVWLDNGTPTDPSDDTVQPGSGPNWAGGQSYVLHNGGKNYAWMRNRITLPTVPSGKITYRFVLESGGGTGVRRYYVDDIKIDNASGRTITVCSSPNTKETCGSYWNMDDPGQKNDFVTSGRWDLSSTNVVFNDDGSPSMSWDISKGTNPVRYARFGPEQPNASPVDANGYRVHSIEFNGQISLPYNADGSGGQPDFEGDDGYPMLTFSMAYALEKGDSIEIQWTRDALDATPDTWQAVQVMAQVAYNGSAIGATMDKYEVELRNISNWNTEPFRLRFALKVDKDYETTGLYIDNIVLERKGVPRYSQYPFCDTSEEGMVKWQPTGQWAITNASGAFGSPTSFTDSPGGNYLHGQQTSLELKYPIDFNNDTPENLTTWGGNKDCANNPSGPATRAIMSFWHWRRVTANDNIHVDLFRMANSQSGTAAIAPTSIWSYTYNSRTRDQVAWERVEIDLNEAIRVVTGQTLAQLAANGDPRDDDFFVAIRLDARSDGSVSDGVYVDFFDIKEYAETTHKLWNTGASVTPVTGAPPAGAGNGPRYVDDIDQPAEWWLRWRTGGTWSGIDWEAHSGVRSFHDSPEQGVNYRDNTYSVLEMNRIIDLRGASTADNPTLYFWDRYNIGDDDVIRVEIAIQDQNEMVTACPPGTGNNRRCRQGYNYAYDWGSTASYGSNSSWQSIWSRGEFSRMDTWGREQIDLRNFADNPATPANEGKRIRIRFVLDALDNGSSLRDGWWIDDIRIEYRQPRVIGLAFFDPAQNTSNWVTEGQWGLAPDLWKGSGGGTAALGPNDWQVWWIDCLQWMTNAGRTVPLASPNDLNPIACTISQVNNFFNAVPRTITGTDDYFTARPQWTIPNRRLRDSPPIINNDFGSTGRPFGAPTGTTGNTWDDYYMGRFIRDITVLAGDYTFITTSDNAVRLRYETTPPSAPSGWNIINNWTNHSRTVNMGTVNLVAGDYTLVMEWYEGDQSAVIILQVGNNNFSFSDSPRACATCDWVRSVPYGNSSLILDGVLNLNTPINPSTNLPVTNWRPRMQFFTYYDLGGSWAARTEVSIDGGFSWTQNNLSLNCPTGLPSAQCNPTIWGSSTWMPSQGRDWMARSHDLRSYVDQYVGLRFRLNVPNADLKDGWWITEIQVNN
ncbi:MAG: hypothetical protein K8L97_29930 [Anaerolineae bacterium]|nr:hypothetical protein [Anaerolineae bacterium]